MTLKTFLTPNVGRWDRLIRALPFAAFVYLWAAGLLAGPALWAAGIVSAMLLATAITGMCSIYALLGINTRKRETP